MMPRDMTSGFPNRGRMRRNPFDRRNNRSTPLRRLHISRSYSQGSIRLPRGGTAGPDPKSSTGRRPPLPSYARSINGDGFPCRSPGRWGGPRPSGASRARPGDNGNVTAVRASRQPDGSRWSIPTGSAAGLRAVFPSRTGSVGTDLHDRAVHRHRFRLDLDELFLPDILENPFGNPALRPAVHPGVDGMPTSEPGRQSPSFAAMLGNIRDGIGYLRVQDAHIPPLYPKKRCNLLIVPFSQIHLEPP